MSSSEDSSWNCLKCNNAFLNDGHFDYYSNGYLRIVFNNKGYYLSLYSLFDEQSSTDSSYSPAQQLLPFEFEEAKIVSGIDAKSDKFFGFGIDEQTFFTPLYVANDELGSCEDIGKVLFQGYISLPGKKPPSFREGMNCLIQTHSNY